MCNSRVRISPTEHFNANDERRAIYATIHATLLSINRNFRCRDGIAKPNRNKLNFVHVYILFSFILFFLLLFPYIFFTQLPKNNEEYQHPYVFMFCIAVASNGAIQGIRQYLDGCDNKFLNGIAVFNVASVVLCDTWFAVSHTYEHGAAYLLAFPLWLALVPSCYLAYHFIHRRVSAFGRSIKIPLQSINKFRSFLADYLRAPSYVLRKAHLSIAIVSTVAVLLSIIRGDLPRTTSRCFPTVLFFTGYTSGLFITNENERLDPHGYIEKTKSFVSPYFATCGLAMLGMVFQR